MEGRGRGKGGEMGGEAEGGPFDPAMQRLRGAVRGESESEGKQG